ncbi:MAG: NAD(P)/FAD-dependent oxidoreductase [Firmicutes bacterium]|nr:NAD(P)/FAD-dependent oxidoreductase [Bacillota bacterium]
MATARCVVLGGGFGGLAAAHRLRARLGDDAEVTLIDRRNTFMMGLRILTVLAGRGTRTEGTRPLTRLAARGIRYVQDEVTAIDLERRTVRTRTSGTWSYDALVVALGADLRPDLVPGYDPSGSNLYDPEQAETIAARIAALDAGRIGIGILGVPYKCPPAPYEAAFLIEEVLRRRGVRGRVDLEVFTPQPSSLPVAGPAACAAVEGQLAAKGIAFLPGRRTAGVEGQTVVFEGGERRRYDVFIGVPPHRGPAVVKAAGLTADDWIRPDPRTCRLPADGVFAVGDVAEFPLPNGMMLPKAGVFAEAQGTVAADVIADELTGGGVRAAFDGRGHCFIEVGDGLATAVRGDFYAAPEPVIEIAEPSPHTVDEKRAFETGRLEAWF